MPDAASAAGFLNLLKPPGLTSSDAVQRVRRVLGVRRVGHGGTLDPEASGVLPIAFGGATRLLQYVTPDTKQYVAEFTLGIATDTGDAWGRVTSEANASALTQAAVAEAVAALIGTHHIPPPAYSAVVIGGQRAYTLARAGAAVEAPPRPMTVHTATLREFTAGPRATLIVEIGCEAGTYVRSLCTLMGERLGLPATMSALVRTASGPFRIEESHTLEELDRAISQDALTGIVLAADMPLQLHPQCGLDAAGAAAFQHGQTTAAATADVDGLVRVYGEGVFLGMGRVMGERLAPETVLAAQ